MHSLLFLLLLLLTPVLAVSAAHLLTPQNFEQTISQGVWFVEHFSPYCRHCRHFEPTWNDVVDHFEVMSDPGIHLAQVNCALNGDLCNENGVTGYPQMNLYRNGELLDTYDNDREFHLLIEYLTAHAEPMGASQKETVPVVVEEPAPTPTPTPTPRPTPTPSPSSERLVVQTPRSEVNPSGTVVALDVQSFDNFIQQGPAFIEFFAPWCGHCKKLAPTWTQLGRRMQHKLNIAQVDCELHKALCSSQGVTGFPMMFYYAHGVKTEYTGGRSYDQLVSFADKASNPNMQVIDAPELEQVVHDNDVLYLLLHDTANHHIVNDIAKASQSLLGSPPVYISTSPELFHKYSLSPTTPTLLAFKDKDVREPISSLSLSPSLSPTETLKAWLHANRFPTSLELTKDVFHQVMYAPHRPLVVIVAVPTGQSEGVSTKLHEVAQKWRLRARAAAGHLDGSVDTDVGTGAGAGRDVVFTWMDAGQWGKWLKDMYGVKVGTEPEIVVADHERLVYYNKDGSGHAIALNSVSVASALDTILAGTARPKYSQNMLERGVYSLSNALERAQHWIVAHPYLTVLVVLGLICIMVMALRTLFADEIAPWESEKRFAKRDRLD